MAGIGPQDLHNLAAQELLAAAEEALDTIPDFVPGLGGAPERSYVSPGEPAADCCPQLTVHVSSLFEARLSPAGVSKSHVYTRQNHVGLIITLFRCVPTQTETRTGYSPPSETALEEAAAQIDADGWALWNHLFNRMRNGDLFTFCKEVVWEGGRKLVPSGGCGGWVFGFRVPLDGYEEILS